MSQGLMQQANTVDPADDGVYYDPELDPSRPRYPRPPGQVGVVLDVYDAVAVKPKEFHSHHVLLTNFTDRLLEQLRNFPLETVKGVFIEHGLLHGVIFEKIYRGIILSVSVESEDSLENLWEAHRRDDLCRHLQDILVTTETLTAVEAHSLQLRVRLWDDEKNACMTELKSNCLSQYALNERENALAMLDKIREYKKNIPESILRLRDQQANFERDLSEMLLILKGALPADKKGIRTLAEYHKYLQIIREKPLVNTVPFERYNGILETAKEVIQELTRCVYYRLCQVHTAVETENQRKHKTLIRQIAVESLAMIGENYDVSSLRHPEWNSRLLSKEQPFLGLVCLVPVLIDAVSDIDENLDEYMAGLPRTGPNNT